jgi:selenocysteine lyase/cysteine desulfurase
LAAVEFIGETTPEQIHLHEMNLMTRFYDAASRMGGVRVYGDFSGDRAPIVALNIRDYESSQVADELSQVYGIAVRAGAHCAPRLHRALGTQEQGAVRFSFGWFNTEKEVDTAIAAVRSIAEC